MGYVKNDDGTPLGYTVGIVQTQGSSLREQPWALRRNSVGVEDIDNKDQGQISSYQVLRTRENVGVAVATPLMEIPISSLQKCLTSLAFAPKCDHVGTNSDVLFLGSEKLIERNSTLGCLARTASAGPGRLVF